MRRFVNIFSLIAGIVLLLAGAAVAAGKTAASPEKCGILFILGGIIIIWALASMILHRNSR